MTREVPLSVSQQSQKCDFTHFPHDIPDILPWQSGQKVCEVHGRGACER